MFLVPVDKTRWSAVKWFYDEPDFKNSMKKAYLKLLKKHGLPAGKTLFRKYLVNMFKIDPLKRVVEKGRRNIFVLSVGR